MTPDPTLRAALAELERQLPCRVFSSGVGEVAIFARDDAVEIDLAALVAAVLGARETEPARLVVTVHTTDNDLLLSHVATLGGWQTSWTPAFHGLDNKPMQIEVTNFSGQPPKDPATQT